MPQHFMPGPGGGGFDFMFTLIPIIVICGFIFVIGSAVLRGVQVVSSPVISRSARVVAKRTKVWGGGHSTGNGHMSGGSSTSYFATFEFENGEREELQVSGSQYGLLSEGDLGTLTSQGPAFRDFDRVAQ